MTIRLTDVSSARGAPMGRRSYHAHGTPNLEFELERVPLIDGGYDCGGAYWGSPDDLWVARAECDGEEVAFFFVRGDDEMACLKVQEDYPDATFKPQTGSIIEQTIRFLNECLARNMDSEDTESAEQEIEDLEAKLAEIRWALKHSQETK